MNRRPTLLLAAALLGSTAARAEPPEGFASGEFRNTAGTMPKGEFSVHPFLPSHYGISDWMDVKTTPLGFFTGPNGSLEVGAVSTDDFSLSIEPTFQSNWEFDNYTAAGLARTTFGLGDSRLNLSAGVGLAQVTLRDLETERVLGQEDWIYLPLNAGFDAPVSERGLVRVVGSTDLGSFLFLDSANVVDSGGAFTLGANYNHSFGTARLSVGAAVFYGGAGFEALFDALGVNFPPILPFPTFELWFRF